MSQKPNDLESLGLVRVTITGSSDVYLLSQRHCDYLTLLTFVRTNFGVSGDLQSIWLERGGCKYLLAPVFWDDYLAIFAGNALRFQFAEPAPAVDPIVNKSDTKRSYTQPATAEPSGAKPSGALVLTYNWPVMGDKYVSLYRDDDSWMEVCDNIRRCYRKPWSGQFQCHIKEPYPEWWAAKFGKGTVIDARKWNEVVAVASQIAPDVVTDLCGSMHPM
ncbi:hypothetical protein K440DRAFT_665107 [Wilcoxina mikolae CBS 423.85]|nr:hypothetical protein K440DRAFT_665107 [Wilcoxina mikolae CBS 423.85]